MAKNLIQQLIDGIGTIKMENLTRDFMLPNCMTGAKDIIQDEEAMIEYLRNIKTEKYPEGILLNVIHEGFAQMRVGFAADVKNKAIEKIKDADGKIINEINHFMTMDIDCSIDWIPSKKELPQATKTTVQTEKAEKDAMQMIFDLMNAGHKPAELQKLSPKQLKELHSTL